MSFCHCSRARRNCIKKKLGNLIILAKKKNVVWRNVYLTCRLNEMFPLHNVTDNCRWNQNSFVAICLFVQSNHQAQRDTLKRKHIFFDIHSHGRHKNFTLCWSVIGIMLCHKFGREFWLSGLSPAAAKITKYLTRFLFLCLKWTFLHRKWSFAQFSRSHAQ